MIQMIVVFVYLKFSQVILKMKKKINYRVNYNLIKKLKILINKLYEKKNHLILYCVLFDTLKKNLLNNYLIIN